MTFLAQSNTNTIIVLGRVYYTTNSWDHPKALIKILNEFKSVIHVYYVVSSNLYINMRLGECLTDSCLVFTCFNKIPLPPLSIDFTCFFKTLCSCFIRALRILDFFMIWLFIRRVYLILHSLISQDLIENSLLLLHNEHYS